MPVGPPEHRPHCRHDDRPENVLGRPDKSPRARVKPKRRCVSAGKSVPHPPRFSLSAAEPEVRIHLSPAASHTNPSIAADLLIERDGGMTGIGSAEPGGIRLIWGSTPTGGVITPLEQG